MPRRCAAAFTAAPELQWPAGASVYCCIVVGVLFVFVCVVHLRHAVSEMQLQQRQPRHGGARHSSAQGCCRRRHGRRRRLA